MRTLEDLEEGLNIAKVTKKDIGIHRRKVELLKRGTWDKRM